MMLVTISQNAAWGWLGHKNNLFGVFGTSLLYSQQVSKCSLIGDYDQVCVSICHDVYTHVYRLVLCRILFRVTFLECLKSRWNATTCLRTPIVRSWPARTRITSRRGSGSSSTARRDSIMEACQGMSVCLSVKGYLRTILLFASSILADFENGAVSEFRT